MQGNRLYVGNLKYSVTADQLRELFSNHGSVTEANVIDGKGFGFVEMSSSAEAEQAKEALDGADLEGRAMRVDEAKPPKSKPKRDFRR